MNKIIQRLSEVEAAASSIIEEAGTTMKQIKITFPNKTTETFENDIRPLILMEKLSEGENDRKIIAVKVNNSICS